MKHVQPVLVKHRPVSLRALCRSPGGLDELVRFVGKADVLAMGEAAHGANEFASVKGDLIRQLIVARRFQSIMLELPDRAAAPIDDFVRGARGNARELLWRTGFWTVANREVLELILWIRLRNSRSMQSTRIGGCDMDVGDPRRESRGLRDRLMALNCERQLGRLKTRNTIFWTHNAHASYAHGNWFTGTGFWLRKSFGSRMRNIGLFFGHGKLKAIIPGSGRLSTVSLSRPEPQSWESWIDENAGAYTFVETDWISRHCKTGARTVREIGAMYDPSRPGEYVQKVDLTTHYDAVAYLREVAPVELLPPVNRRKANTTTPAVVNRAPTPSTPT